LTVVKAFPSTKIVGASWLSFCDNGAG